MPNTHQTARKLALREYATLLAMDFSTFQYAYALSGGIGSGKSSVCRILKSLGYAIIDADVIAHGVLQDKKDAVVANFGEGVLDDGVICRKKLGEIVFADHSKLECLNQILALGICQRIYEECLRLEEREEVYFVEIALLFEDRETYNFKHNILIACSKEEQIKRVMQRNKLTSKEVSQRIQAQFPLAQKLTMAQYVLWNEGDMEDLQEEIKIFLNKIK